MRDILAGPEVGGISAGVGERTPITLKTAQILKKCMRNDGTLPSL
jgi:hypothetical protein